MEITRRIALALTAFGSALTARSDAKDYIVANRPARAGEVLVGAIHIRGRIIDPGRIYTQAAWERAKARDLPGIVDRQRVAARAYGFELPA